MIHRIDSNIHVKSTVHSVYVCVNVVVHCAALYTWFTHPYTLADYFHFQVSVSSSLVFFSLLIYSFVPFFYTLFISFAHIIIINL